jgi:hypothetical protein
VTTATLAVIVIVVILGVLLAGMVISILMDK